MSGCCEEVERLRSTWRPERVRVVVLAESHVWTSRDETGSRVTQPDGIETGFARFVYCLGYGEARLVKPEVKRNAGTWQFWRLFDDTVCDPTNPETCRRLMKTGEKNWQQRVQNKLDLLKEMRRAGVWLVDASVTALYHKGAKLATGDDYRSLLKACWESYIREVVRGCAPPLSAVLIVGKAVNSAIEEDVRQDLDGVEVAHIRQPNAHMSREDIARDRQVCFDLCSRHLA